jgi:hypothetical protein
MTTFMVLKARLTPSDRPPREPRPTCYRLVGSACKEPSRSELRVTNKPSSRADQSTADSVSEPQVRSPYAPNQRERCRTAQIFRTASRPTCPNHTAVIRDGKTSQVPSLQTRRASVSAGKISDSGGMRRRGSPCSRSQRLREPARVRHAPGGIHTFRGKPREHIE